MFSIFRRVNDILNANVNDLLDKIEDPERMIKQLIREMEEQIAQAKDGVIHAIASEKQLSRELAEQKTNAAEWQGKAETALQLGKEDLARSALQRKLEIDNVIRNLEPAWQTAKNTSERLKTQLHQLESKLEETKRKQGALVARQRAAQARQQMGKTLDRFQQGLDTQSRFDRLEDRIDEMEAYTEAMAEVNDKQSELDKEFAKLESTHEVDLLMAELKVKVQQK
ncbi:phage shock protein A (IM30), suppresses sigma54-dependent transcription [Beggiatoa alba B18LD]|uniref:Phage shock protein A (IM30), suppresses sigma54-dependent transcription n=1 Tax=Beggiatoa alba B18LD TaxID=395493 RepID=I3CIS9_9GAMM|nr:PspA/IM30 family protein [Beggiatoa alba]EIJ43522.1 phage shock protein A (IM30), suppresses sigma54-dependent transcription [Beggiatoa alba B18LD]